MKNRIQTETEKAKFQNGLAAYSTGCFLTFSMSITTGMSPQNCKIYFMPSVKSQRNFSFGVTVQEFLYLGSFSLLSVVKVRTMSLNYLFYFKIFADKSKKILGNCKILFSYIPHFLY